MTSIRPTTLAAFFLLATAAMATLAPAAHAQAPRAPQPAASAVADDATRDELVQASEQLRAGSPQDAIDRLDALIGRYDATYGTTGLTIYCAHFQAEQLGYEALARQKGQKAQVIDGTWADAYFLRGFAQFEQGRMADAEASYRRAIVLSPNNPHYLSQLAELRSRAHAWPEALALYRAAEDTAPTYALPQARNIELGRALRGIGFVQVELGHLDEAEKAYRRCLDLDPDDEKARGELGYVIQRRAQAPADTSH